MPPPPHPPPVQVSPLLNSGEGEGDFTSSRVVGCRHQGREPGLGQAKDKFGGHQAGYDKAKAMGLALFLILMFLFLVLFYHVVM